MKNVILVIVILVASVASAEEKEKPMTPEGDFTQLSTRFLAALQSEKLEDCMACWASVEQMKKLMENPPKGIPKPPPQALKEMVTYFQQRDKVIKDRFPKIIKALKANGADPKTLTYVKSDGVVRKKGTWEQAGNVDMTFKRADGALVELSVDDGFKMDGTWYFSDKPHTHIVFTQGGKERMVVIEDQAIQQSLPADADKPRR